jgi:hypothetical protein
MRTTEGLRFVIGAAIGALLAGSEPASGWGVAAFLAPGKAVDGEVIDASYSAKAFRARLSLPAPDGFRQAVSFGYSNYPVKRDPGIIAGIYALTDDAAVVPAAYGWDIGRFFGPVMPYAGGGGVLALEFWDSPFSADTEVDFVPGVYVNAGVEYRVAGWALEFGPRYSVLFDSPVAAVDINGVHPGIRTGSFSHYLDFLAGVAYYF